MLKLGNGAHMHLQTTKQKKEKEGAWFFAKTWRWHPPAPISSKTKRKKWELAFVKSWQWRPLAPISSKEKEKNGSWPLSKVGNGAHQNQNRKK